MASGEYPTEEYPAAAEEYPNSQHWSISSGVRIKSVNWVFRILLSPPCEGRRGVECRVHPSMDLGKFWDFHVQKIERKRSEK
jgi:hypothetical protein